MRKLICTRESLQTFPLNHRRQFVMSPGHFKPMRPASLQDSVLDFFTMNTLATWASHTITYTRNLIIIKNSLPSTISSQASSNSSLYFFYIKYFILIYMHCFTAHNYSTSLKVANPLIYYLLSHWSPAFGPAWIRFHVFLFNQTLNLNLLSQLFPYILCLGKTLNLFELNSSLFSAFTQLKVSKNTDINRKQKYKFTQLNGVSNGHSYRFLLTIPSPTLRRLVKPLFSSWFPSLYSLQRSSDDPISYSTEETNCLIKKHSHLYTNKSTRQPQRSFTY